MARRIEGLAARYDSLSENLGGFREVLKPGCFDHAVRAGQDTLCRAEHDSRMLLGRVSSGTLALELRSAGLWYACDLPNTGPGRATYELIERQDVSRSSFAFSIDRAEDEDWEVMPDGTLLRMVLRVAQLVDTAPVASPAYLDTAVAVARFRDDVTVGDLARARAGGAVDLEAERWRLELGLRAVEGRAMTGQVEMAALATRGVPVDRRETFRRGRLVVGRKLLRREALAKREGLAEPELSDVERLCKFEAQAEEDTERRG